MTPLVFKRRGRTARLAELLNKLGTCGNVGLIIGIIAGGLLTLQSIRTAPLRPTPAEVFWFIVILSVFCWLMLLFVYAVLLRSRVLPILFGTLLRSIVICLFTVLIAHVSGAYRLGIFIGIFVGLFFGFILCRVLNRVMG